MTPGRDRVHSGFLALRLDPGFRRADPVTRASAAAEFRTFLRHPLGQSVVRPHVAFGSRDRFDLLFWITGAGARATREVLSALQKTQLGRHLDPVLDAAGAGSDLPSESPYLALCRVAPGDPPDWGTLSAALARHPGLKLAEYESLAGDGRLLAFQYGDPGDFPAFVREVGRLGTTWAATLESPDGVHAALAL